MSPVLTCHACGHRRAEVIGVLDGQWRGFQRHLPSFEWKPLCWDCIDLAMTEYRRYREQQEKKRKGK